MKVWVLGSGSRGNAVLLDCGGARVLIDAGFPIRALEQRLRAVSVDPASVEAVVVTHEHADHVKGAAIGARRHGWALYATAGTAACPELAAADVRTVERSGTIALTTMDVRTVPTSHDAAEPIAVVVTARATGVRVGVVTDTGAVTEPLREACRELDLLVLESNHDEGMLRAGPYPVSVQRRIAGRTGHLSNRVAAAFARECTHRRLSEIALAHLSERCNDPRLATSDVGDALRAARFRGRLRVAVQDRPVGPLEAHLAGYVGGAQLALGL